MNAPLVLWYTPVTNVAGVGRHLLDVARIGIPGYRVVFAVPEGQLADELRDAGAAVATGALGVDDGPRSAVGQLRSLVKKLSPQIVHTHLAFADLVAQLALVGVKTAAGERVCLVSTEHGIAADSTLYQANKYMAGLKLRLHSLRASRTDRIIAVSDSTAQQVKRQWGASTNVVVVRNGVDRSHQIPRQPGLRILSLARLSHEKRIDALVEAFDVLASEHPGASLTIAGEGPLESALRQQVQRKGLAQRVVFPGFVSAERAMLDHDVVVQLSAWENLSYTLLDAVASGMGVVATPVGGNPEILPPSCLVSADDPTRIARAIADQGLAVEKRPQLPASVPNVSDMTAAIAGIYQEVLA